MRTEFKETGKEDIFSRQLVAETQATLDAANSDDSAQPARLFVHCSLPKLRRKNRM